jgi:hypothetical protein
MSRHPARVSQADLNRVAKAIAAAGGRVAAEIAKDGTIRLVPCEQSKDSGEKRPAYVEPEGEPVL